jgi:hypothetical protein
VNAKTALLVLAGIAGAGYFIVRARDDSAPLREATTFHYVFEGSTQTFTQEQFDEMERKIQESTPALGVQFSDLPSGGVLFAFTLPAGATPPPRVIRMGTVVARRQSALPAVEG